MNDRLSWLAALAVVGAVAGCSDSVDEILRPDYEDLADEYDALDEASDDLAIVDPALLPLSGGATYDGVMVLSTNGEDGLPSDLAGDMTLRADFGDDSLSGSVVDVVTDDDDRLEGSLVIANGEIDRDDDLEDFYTYAFDVDGVLTEDDGSDLRVSATGAGDFLGRDHRTVVGDVEGRISSGSDRTDLNGGFVGVR